MAAMSMVRRRRQRPAPAAPHRRPPTIPPDSTPTLPDRAIHFANQAVLPVYVLHQTVIVVIGYYVVQWKAGTLVKYLGISFAALLVALVLYDLGVRRTAVTRLLFGMKPAARQATRDGTAGL